MYGSVYRYLPGFFKPFIFQIVFIEILEILYCCFSLLTTYLNGYSVDVLSSSFAIDDLVRILCLYGALGFVYFFISYCTRMSRLKMRKRANFHLRHVVLDKIGTSDYQDVCKAGNQINILALLEDDIPRISGLPIRLLEIVTYTVQLTITVFLLFGNGHLVGMLGVVMVFCSFVTVYFFGRKMIRTSTEVQKTWDECLDNYRHQVFQFKNIRLLDIMRLYRNHEDVLEENNFFQEVKRERYVCLRTVANITYWISVGLIYLIEGIEVMNGNLTIGAIITTTGLLGEVVVPCDTVVYNIQSMQIIHSSAERLNTVLAMPRVCENVPVKDGGQTAEGSLIFDNVCFQYDGAESKVIDGVTASLAQNGITFLRGRNGMGKTTFLLLLSGLLRETSGCIHRPSDTFGKSEIASVFTDMEIPRIPLRTFIEGLGCDTLWLQEKSCQLLDENLLDRFNVAIEENKILDETSLSVGQRQKIMFLLVLAQHKPVLLLDEAFSSMDADSEQCCYGIVREELKKSLIYCVCAEHTEKDLTEQDTLICALHGAAS